MKNGERRTENEECRWFDSFSVLGSPFFISSGHSRGYRIVTLRKQTSVYDVRGVREIAPTSNSGAFAVKQLHPLLKLSAIATSVLLVSAFVSYRAGAINWFVKSGDRPAEVG